MMKRSILLTCVLLLALATTIQAGFDKLAPQKSIIAQTTQTRQPGSQRIGLFIGISEYSHPKVADLRSCHKDAMLMTLAMQNHGELDAIGTLLNKEATRANIERAFNELKSKSKPGDEIFIYFSGHAGQYADTSGDEEDGMDEFLAPCDVDPDNLSATIIIDDTLSKWIEALEGRRVTLIVDGGHSGGILDMTEKSVAKQNQQDTPQEKVTGLFSSLSSEVSAERRDGQCSVMTYFLAKKIIETNGPVTIEEAYDYVKVEVPKYMKKHFPNHTQTPILIQADQEVFLKPQPQVTQLRGIQVQQCTVQSKVK